MVILYFGSEHHIYYHGDYYHAWTSYDKWFAGEAAWLVPGTDPDDCFWC